MTSFVFRFRVSLEDNEHVIRIIDILPTQTFSDLQNVIGQAFNFNVVSEPCFYRCDHNWIMSKKAILTGEYAAGEETLLRDKITDPHQKFFHVFHKEAGWNFLIELDKILPGAEATLEYPHIVEAKGTAPAQFPSTIPDKMMPEDDDESELEELEEIVEDEVVAEGSFDDMIIDQPEAKSESEED